MLRDAVNLMISREMELFERARREAAEDRRRTMAVEAQRQDEARQDRAR
jgi:hypothetical protein